MDIKYLEWCSPRDRGSYMVAVIFQLLNHPRFDSYLDKTIRMFELFSLCCEIICLENWIHSLLGFRHKPSEDVPSLFSNWSHFLLLLSYSWVSVFTQPSLPRTTPLWRWNVLLQSPWCAGWEKTGPTPFYSQWRGWTIWRQSDPSQGRFCSGVGESIPLSLNQEMLCWHLGERTRQPGV